MDLQLPIFGILFVLIATIGVGTLIFWLWMLIDCATNEPSKGNDKVVWILLIVLLGWLGALLYLLIRRPQRIREVGR